jgi:hypothetical protein
MCPLRNIPAILLGLSMADIPLPPDEEDAVQTEGYEMEALSI